MTNSGKKMLSLKIDKYVYVYKAFITLNVQVEWSGDGLTDGGHLQKIGINFLITLIS